MGTHHNNRDNLGWGDISVFLRIELTIFLELEYLRILGMFVVMDIVYLRQPRNPDFA